MIHYLDTSALVKRYVPEVGHEVVTALNGPAVSSALAAVELRSALWRRARSRPAVTDHVRVLLDAFDAAVHSWTPESFRLSLVSVTSDIVAEAGRMVARHDLGSLDAVHLATASVVRRTIDPEVVVAVFDRRLRVALTAEGFALVPALLEG